MVTGEKLEEFRVPGKWIESRLFDRNGNPRSYDAIEYTNGYGAKRPRFVTDFKGVELLSNGINVEYSNGLIVDCKTPVYVIRHSRVICTSNTKKLIFT